MQPPLTRRCLLAAVGSVAVSRLIPSAEAVGPAPGTAEAILDRDRRIVDAHHHLWDNPGSRYLFPELLVDLNDGHQVVKTVFIEAGAMYRADAAPELRSLGETEFANGIAAMSASGGYGPCRVNSAIIGSVDLRVARAREILEAHVAAGGGRFRGVRTDIPWNEHLALRSIYPHEVLSDPAYRRGFSQLQALGLSCEIWALFNQLRDVAELADAFPDTSIIIGHLGTPVRTGYFSDRQSEVFAAWKAALTECARRSNTVLKVGGLGMKLGSYLFLDTPPADSAALAAAWGRYLDTAIGIFGPSRCMFESNFPADRATCSYRTLWNAFKRIAAPYSEMEKTALFSATAERVYRI